MDLTGEIKDKISEFVGIKRDKVIETGILKDLVVDSFILVDLVIQLQEHFKIRLTQEDLSSVQTVGDLIQLLTQKIKAN